MKTLSVKKLNPEAKLPVRAHANDAGLDIFSLVDVTLPPHEPAKIATGIAVAIADGYVGMICDRSSLGSKGIATLGGIIDAGYRGEIHVVVINHRNEPMQLHRGDKIAQLLVMPVSHCTVTEVAELDSTERAGKGFGSSGR